jgi:hypothetical protein
VRVRRAPFIGIEEVCGRGRIGESTRQDGVDEWITVELWQAIP